MARFTILNIMSALLKVLSEEEKSSFDSYSVSRVKTFDACAKQFRLQYIEKLPRKEWHFHIFGKFLHSVLENFYKEMRSGKPWNLTMKEAFIVAYGEYSSKLTVAQIAEAKDILTKFLFKLAEKRDNNTLPEILNLEKEFNIIIDDKILFNGFIDLEQLDVDGVYHVLDYKTTQKKQYLKDRFQLLSYAFVLCLKYPEIQKVRTSFLLLRHNCESLVEEYTREKIMTIEQQFIDYAEKIKKEKLFRAKPSNLCKFCSYLDPKLCSEGWNYINPENLW